ncbi:MAG: hypothetical protein JXR03_05155 [Cyclobacteriaceae bacterium]
MMLTKERELIGSFKEKIVSNQDLSKQELLAICTEFEDTVELAQISMKIINRLRVNCARIQSV